MVGLSFDYIVSLGENFNSNWSLLPMDAQSRQSLYFSDENSDENQ